MLTRLVSLLSLPEPTADLISAYMIASLTPQAAAGLPGASTGNRPLPLVFPEDLARIPGLDPAVVPRLAPYVVVLDMPTPVNFNTASAEVIAAVAGLSLSDARGLVADRDHTYFNSVGDIDLRLRGRGTGFSDSDASVGSSYFFIRGEIKLERADTRMEALVKRGPVGQPAPVNLLWEREL